ncbi:patatin-like phospholipase family protein [Pusillimonas sp. MFBS29]|nr:patatin-like phospholipase family protein [Pusillimonas sp. MFBS29]MCC2597680.1 patatin-like phospholipase family protein [Pusillimonas sp. MFBS29]
MPPYETIALVLQGGGALGAYQAGVFQGLHEAGIEPGYLSGISIGALNTAIIAGNPPEARVARLKEFWETICQPNFGLSMNPFVEQSLFNLNDPMRQTISAWHAGSALLNGQKGFFQPRFPPAPQNMPGDPRSASYYDTSALKDTLERLCDFDRINAQTQHVSVGAVNVRNGNLVYFDNFKIQLRAEHFMASGALPPAFAAVEIDGEYYWDGGLVSNTPLTEILDSRPLRDTLVFQVDLWSARGSVPSNMSEVSDRIKDIRYSSRTRMVTDQLRWSQYLRHMLQHILDDLPEEARASNPYFPIAQDLACSKRYNVIHLIYRNQAYEKHYKDFEFGLATMRGHWDSGLRDIRHTLDNPDRLAMPENASGFVTHDIHREDLEQLMDIARNKLPPGAS